MSKISCSTCLDLMPLVVDGVSSEDSKKLVEDHIEKCDKCRIVYTEPNQINLDNINLDDNKVLRRVKQKLYSLAGLVLILGTIAGLSLSDSQSFFYNFLIMPLLGLVAYLAFGKKAYISSIGIFIIGFIHQTIGIYLSGHYADIKGLLFEAFSISFLFVTFYFLGIIIFKLFSFSIFGRKEN